MNSDMISNIFISCLQQMPQEIERCAVGIGNYVYIVKCDDIKYVFRCSIADDAYVDTIYWLKELSIFDIPVPKVLFYGKCEEYNYLILNFFEGKDIGIVYQELTKAEKKKIAKDVIEIQRKVSRMQIKHIEKTWSWVQVVDELLERADKRIVQNGYFDNKRVQQLQEAKNCLEDYFASVKPIAYLDDISTKNLLIHNGEISGIIDIDWMGVGDNLTFIALTYIALLNMNYETDYVDYLLEERCCSDLEMKAFLFYALVYCVDFMGERGSKFGDKEIEVNAEIINRLNQIYEMLWERWCEKITSCTD